MPERAQRPVWTEPSPNGPPRKVFHVSAQGHRALSAWTAQWVQTTTTITGLLASAGALETREETADVPS